MEKSFPGQEDDQARRVALLAEPTFFFFCSRKRLATFSTEMYEKLAHSGKLRQVDDPSTLDNFSPYKV